MKTKYEHYDNWSDHNSITGAIKELDRRINILQFIIYVVILLNLISFVSKVLK